MDAALTAAAIEAFGGNLRSVGAVNGWDGPTPCADWDVRALANHVLSELLWMPPLLAGRTIAEVGAQFEGDVLGDDPVANWATAAGDALDAAARPGAQEDTVHLSFGDFPGSDYLGQITSDLVLHGWDLARALGADDTIAPSLIEFVDGFLTPQVDAWRSAGAFGSAVQVGPDASPQERLIALSGRAPDWSP